MSLVLYKLLLFAINMSHTIASYFSLCLIMNTLFNFFQSFSFYICIWFDTLSHNIKVWYCTINTFACFYLLFIYSHLPHLAQYSVQEYVIASVTMNCSSTNARMNTTTCKNLVQTLCFWITIFKWKVLNLLNFFFKGIII